MAGRNISVTHVALGSTRVMATCALCGQAVAAAAVLTQKYGITPREVGRKHIRELQTLLAEDDSVLPMVPIPVKGLPAAVSASSEFTLRMTEATSSEPLLASAKNTDDPCDVPPNDRRRAQMFIVSENRLETFSVRLEAREGVSKILTAELLDEHDRPVASAQAQGVSGIAEFHFHADTTPGRRYAVRLPAVPEVSVCLNRRYLPGLERKLDGCYLDNDNWCLETVPPLRLYPAANVLNGLARPGEDASNMWISEPGLPQWLELELEEEQAVCRVELIFDTNLDKSCNCGVPRECVRDYRLQTWKDGKWVTLAEVSGNYQRRRVHGFNPVRTKRLRLLVTATNGDPSARVYCFRVFGEPPRILHERR